MAVLCLFSLGATGGTIYGDNISTRDGKVRLGEWTIVLNGWLAVLYRKSGPDYLGASQLLLDRYRQHRQGRSVQSATIVTMREARAFCDPATGDPNNPGDKCHWALRDEEWPDFHDDSLVPVAATPGKCIVVQMNNNGTNWTTRVSGDKHCTP